MVIAATLLQRAFDHAAEPLWKNVWKPGGVFY
jgi:hypothetical protein